MDGGDMNVPFMRYVEQTIQETGKILLVLRKYVMLK